MQKTLNLLILLMASTTLHAQTYTADILGDGYLQRTIVQPNDYAGKVVCTLIKKPTQESTHKAIIYIHGYNDYFFQAALGDSVQEHKFNFYAVDLRKYGRSLREGQDTFYCKKLEEYFPDIDSALATAVREGNDTLILMGHSTGGLIASLYVNERQNLYPIKGLILNSPFFDWNFDKKMENIVMPCVNQFGTLFKQVKVQGAGKTASGYARSLSKDDKGEWKFNSHWKIPEGHAKKAGWVRAISRGQHQVQKGLSISCPILLMSSDTSAKETDEWQEIYRRADIVLDVNDIQKEGKKIGNQVTSVKIKGGKHDLLLSEEDARNTAYNSIFDWLKSNKF